MGIIDKFDDSVRLNLRRFGLTALPLFSVTVALNVPLEVALLCGTSCSALALLGSRPAKIRPTVGRQMYRTAQYLLANFAPFAENSTIKPCLLFAMQLDGLDAWRTRFGREATWTLLQHAYDRINCASTGPRKGGGMDGRLFQKATPQSRRLAHFPVRYRR